MKIFRTLQLLRIAVLLVAAALLAHRGRAQSPPSETLVFAPAADTYIDQGHQSTSYDTDVKLRADVDPLRVIYLRFAVTGVSTRTVQQARIRLGVAGPSDSGGAIHLVSDNAWDPALVTYKLRPVVDGPALQTLGPIAVGDVVEFDVTSAITGDGVYSFAIDTASTDGLDYNSSAALGGQLPQLLVKVPQTGPAPMIGITQPPEGSSYYVGDPTTLQASATDPTDGDLSAAVSWQSDLQGPLGTGASISPTLIEGAHTITASVTNSWTLTETATVHVTVGPRPHVNVEPLVTIIAPFDRRSFTVGTDIQFAAVATDLEEGPVGAGLAWTSDRDGAIGTGTSFVRTLSPGTHQITASVSDTEGLTGTATITVTVMPPMVTEFVPVADAFVDSGSASANFGTALVLRVDANVERDAFIRFQLSGVGSQQVTRAILRLTADTGTSAPSDEGGDVHLVTDNTWTETGVKFSTRPAMTGAPLASMPGAIAAGQVVDFDVTSAAIHGDGPITFGITSTSSDGVDYSSREGAAPPKLILTLSGNAPLVAIVAPPNNSVYFKDQPAAFSATATDVEDGDLADQLSWFSSLDGALGGGPNVSTSALSIGRHTISSGVVDADGHFGEAQLNVRVRGPNQPPHLTIDAPASGGSAPAGTPVGLAATATDDFDSDLGAAVQWTSSRGGALGSGASLVRTLAEGTHTLTASVADSDGAAASASLPFTVTPTPPTVAITAPAAGAAFFQNAGVAFTATATDVTDGDLAAAIAWRSSVDGPLGTGASITPLTLSIGAHVVTASVRDASGLVAEDTRNVTVRPPNMPPVLAILAPADGARLLTGKPILLSATATDTEDGNLGATVRWTSSLAGNLGTGATLTVPSLAVGAHTITAAVTDRDGTAVNASVAVTVFPSSLTFGATADTYVDSGSPTKTFGTVTSMLAGSSPVRQGYLRFAVAGMNGFAVEKATLRLTVGTKSADAAKTGGSIQALFNDTWSEATTTYNNRPAVTGPVLASMTKAVKVKQVVDFDVTAGLAGDGSYNFALIHTISDYVTYQTRESTAKPALLVMLKQNTGPVVTITAPAPGTVSTPGTPVTLTGTATDAETGNLSAQIAWSSNLDGALGTGASIVVPALSPGLHTITASVTDASGATAQATTTVTTDHPPVVTITGPAAIVFTTAKPFAFAGTASDVEDGDLTAQLQWTSSLDGALGTGGSFTHDLQVGSHTITARVTDQAGVTREAQRTVRVREPNTAPVITITSPTSPGTPAGTPVTLNATVTDDFDTNLAAAVVWTSSRSGALGSGNPLVETLVEGAHTLTATVTDSDGASASATIPFTITSTPPTVAITNPAAGATFFQNTTPAFTATATDATDGDISGNVRWSSNVGGALGTGASITPTLAVGTHTITATVTDASSLSASATRTVTVRPPNVAPVLAIVSPLDGAALLSGKPVALTATADDTEDGNLAAAIKWTSSLGGNLGTGGSLTLSNLAIGAHTLTASVTDRDGTTTTASVQVTVSASALAFGAVADTYVDAGSPTSVSGGTATGLRADGSPINQAYLRFAVTGVGRFAVEKAILRLTVGTASGDASAFGGTIQKLDNGTWSEATTNYNNRPTPLGAVLATRTTSVAVKQVVDFDVTTGMGADGVYNFALTSSNSDVVLYQSREGASKPALLLMLKQNTGPVVTITAPVNGTVGLPGEAITFTATATDVDTGNLGAQIVWTSSLDGALGTGPSVTAPALSPGTHVVTAGVTDASGAASEATVTVIIDNPPAIAITTPADGAMLFTTSKPYTFTATATDVEDGDLRPQLAWASDVSGALGTGGSITRDLPLGPHTITATATDAAGVTRQAVVHVRVRTPNAPPVLHLTAPAGTTTIAAGATIALQADASDDFDGDITDRIAWTSTLDGALGTGGSLSLRLGHEGAHTITARVVDSDGSSAMASVSVTVSPSAPVVTLTAPVTGALVFANLGTTFTASAIDATEGDISSRIVWTSNLDGQFGTGASFASNQLRVGTHTITASATDNGNLTGQTQQTVVVKPNNTYPTIQIVSPADNFGVFVGKSLTFTGAANDAEDGNLSGITDWSSDLDGFLGRARVLTVPSLSAGLHTITAKVTDLKGAPTSTTIRVGVSPRTLTFTPVADTYVDGGATASNFGTAATLVADSSPVKQLYLRFAVSGFLAEQFTVSSARLRLTAGSASTASSPVGGTVQTIVAGRLTWSEEATTFANKPAVDGPVLDVAGAVTANQVVDLDVSRAITGDGPISFALTSTSTDDVIYQSREAASGQPQLVVTLHGPQDPVVTINAPAHGSSLITGSPVSFNATAQDFAGNNINHLIQWTSNVDGALGAGGSFSRTLSAGSHTITASVTDSGGNPGMATARITMVAALPNDGLGVRDWKFDSTIEAGESNEATAQKPESKLWYVDGTWWGTLYPAGGGGHHIFKFNRTGNVWTDTGVVVDERKTSRQDVLWDGSKLYMVSRVVNGTAPGRLLRFSYNSSAKTWSLDAGFPANIGGGNALSLTVAKDTTGTLWIGYVSEKKVYFSHSVGSDTVWTTPALLPFAEAVNLKDDNNHAHDIAGIIALPGKIGVFWSNQNTRKDYFAVHVDGAADTAWTLETAGSGGNFADDHFNMKVASDGRLFVMVKTGYNSPGDILDGLIVRSASGTWSPLINICVADFQPTRELLLLDETRRKIYAFYSLEHRAIYYKESDMDTIAFPDGPGTPLITSSSVTDLNNPMSTKQNVTPESGILVEASSRADSSYWHNFFVP